MKSLTTSAEIKEYNILKHGPNYVDIKSNRIAYTAWYRLINVYVEIEEDHRLPGWTTLSEEWYLFKDFLYWYKIHYREGRFLFYVGDGSDLKIGPDTAAYLPNRYRAYMHPCTESQLSSGVKVARRGRFSGTYRSGGVYRSVPSQETLSEAKNLLVFHKGRDVLASLIGEEEIDLTNLQPFVHKVLNLMSGTGLLTDEDKNTIKREFANKLKEQQP